jgi:hypothetical protein
VFECGRCRSDDVRCSGKAIEVARGNRFGLQKAEGTPIATIEQRVSEQRVIEQRVSEQRVIEQRVTEQRITEPAVGYCG